MKHRGAIVDIVTKRTVEVWYHGVVTAIDGGRYADHEQPFHDLP